MSYIKAFWDEPMPWMDRGIQGQIEQDGWITVYPERTETVLKANMDKYRGMLDLNDTVPRP